MAQVASLVELYREYATIPSLSKGCIDFGKSTTGVSGSFNVHSIWQVRDIERSELVKFSRQFSGVIGQDGQIDIQATGVPIEISETLSATSASGEYRALVRKVINSEGDEKQYLEVWNRTTKLKAIDVQTIEAHGKIYTDDQFGCLEWAADEGHLLYVAEQKEPKAVSYFKRPKCSSPVDEVDPSAKSSRDEDERPGEEYVYREDWGESLVGKKHPVLCVLDVESVVVSILTNLPDDVSAGQAIWAPDDQGVICVGWKEEPRKLGLTYCTNRRSSIYYIDFESATCSVIGDAQKSVRSPRFSPDFSCLVYLQNDFGGPHHSCSQLMKCDWATKEVTVVVDLVFDEAERGFPGIYCEKLPQRCWSDSNRHVIFSSPWHSKTEVVCADINTGAVHRLTSDECVGAWNVLDVTNNLVLASRSSLNIPPHLVIGSLSLETDDPSVIWYPLEKASNANLNFTWKILELQPPEENENPEYPGLKYEAVVVIPSEVKETPRPLIVWSHGGPHSAFTAGYQLYATLFAKLGFVTLLVNYRGSIGFGENSIKSLLSNTGKQDVKDVHFAVESVLKNEGLHINAEQIVLFGGSHGGFLVTHLSGQYPDFYKVCVCRNPVVDISDMKGSTDIPDWCYVESGFGEKFSFDDVPTPDMFTTMWEKSPISHIEKVTIPTMVLLGKKDLRVPPSQGLKYYHILKARGVPVKLHVYNDSHALSKVEVESDAFINIVRWYYEHLQLS